METIEYKSISPAHQGTQKAPRKSGEGQRALGNFDAIVRAVERPERLSSTTVIRDAIKDNLKGISKQKTLQQYEADLEHFAHFLESSEQTNLYDARSKHVTRFLSHLEKKGGSRPDPERKDCSWCRERGYPDGRQGCGWSDSRRKGALSAIRFLYHHFDLDDELPSVDPSHRIPSPRVSTRHQWSPNKEEVKKILQTPADARTRLIVHWLFYAPSRRETFVKAKWEDVDLEQGVWHVIGKNGKPDSFEIHPKLLREFRVYRQWIHKEAEKNARIKDALEFNESAFILLTSNGRPLNRSSLTKILKRHGLKAGVGVRKTHVSPEYPEGKTSDLTPHAMRRAWARIALNDQEIPIDVVSEVLRHSDISTTRKHYAQTKPERARRALAQMSLS
jgi:site-specific recombinase XerD